MRGRVCRFATLLGDWQLCADTRSRRIVLARSRSIGVGCAWT